MKNEKPTVVKRGKITYVIYAEKVVVGVGGNQWISYNQYENWNREGITRFKQVILKSAEDEYDNVVDQLTLASRCDIRGVSTSKPKGVRL